MRRVQSTLSYRDVCALAVHTLLGALGWASGQAAVAPTLLIQLLVRAAAEAPAVGPRLLRGPGHRRAATAGCGLRDADDPPRQEGRGGLRRDGHAAVLPAGPLRLGAAHLGGPAAPRRPPRAGVDGDGGRVHGPGP